MSDNKIIEIIKDAVQPTGEISFEDVRRRIEKQSETEREASCIETLEMIGEGKIKYNIRHIAAFAASAAVVIGLGASLIALGLGSAASDMAASESIVTDETAEESAEAEPESELFIETDGEDNAAAQQIQGAANSSELPSDGNADEEHTFTTMSDDKQGELSYITMVSHYIDALGISVDLPADAYVTGRNVSPDFALLDVYNMSAAQLETNYKKRGIYYNAVWYDDMADVTEIVITMKKDDISEEIFNLKNANEEQLSKIEELYRSYEVNIDAVVGAEYHDVSIAENDQARFFRAVGTVDNRSGRSNHLQYMTIINGSRIEITLIEHFGIDSELTGDEPTEIAEEHEELMESVVSSVKWDKVKSDFWRRNRGTVFYSLIIAIGAAAIIAVLLMPENRKKPAAQIESESPSAGGEEVGEVSDDIAAVCDTAEDAADLSANETELQEGAPYDECLNEEASAQLEEDVCSADEAEAQSDYSDDLLE